MDAAARRADYADVRHVRSRSEHIATHNGTLDRLDKDVKQLRKEIDELRTKSPGDRR